MKSLDLCHKCSVASPCYPTQDGPLCEACRVVGFFKGVLFKPLGFTLLPWQRQVLRGMYSPFETDSCRRTIRRAYIEVSKKNGKQLNLETRIPTPHGWTTMAKIGPGEEVLSPDGLPTSVVAVSETDETERAFRFHFGDGSVLEAGARHEWFAHRINGRCRPGLYTSECIFDYWRKYGHDGERATFRIPVAEPAQLPKANLPVSPYLYGFWIGNGCATKPEITICRSDTDRVLHEIGHAHMSLFRQAGFSDIARVPALRPILVGHYSEKRIRAEYMRASLEQRWALLQGLMDSDGCVAPSGQSIYATILPELASQVLELLASLGIKRTVNVALTDRYGVPNQPCYRVLFTSFDDMPVSRLERKLKNRKPRADAPTRSDFHYVSQIEEIAPRPMRCIQVDSPSHLYLAGDSMVATHNSFLVGGLPLYHLMMDEPDSRPEVYGCAAAKDQAGIVYRAAAHLVQKNDYLREHLRPLSSTKRIVRRDGAGFYAVLSADGDLQDGVEPSLAIIDELHRWKTAKAKTLWDVITSGTISRPEPLTVEITTAGDVYESPICWPEHEYARQILDGSLKSDSFYPAIWAADEQRIKADPEFWKSREARVQANPSHEDHGGFLKDEALAAICQEAQDKPAEQARYMRYHLNLWHQRTERWMPMDAWRRCAKPLVALTDRDCWAGLDLSKTTDLTALVLAFPAPDGSVDVLPFFWLPKERVPAIQKRVHQDVHRWIQQGLIELTDGNVLDYGAVRAKLDWAKSVFRLQEVCFDPWNASNFITGTGGLIDAGYRCIDVRQGPATLSAPMKYLLERVLKGELRHGGHEVLTWNADCVSVRSDANGNIAPQKDRLESDGKRIDGISALVNALVRLTVARPSINYWAGENIVM